MNDFLLPFIGREEELFTSTQVIKSGHPLVIKGDRRSGKTSFCRRLKEVLDLELENPYLLTEFNMEPCIGKSESNAYLHLLIALTGQIARDIFHCKYSEIGKNPKLEYINEKDRAGMSQLVHIQTNIKDLTKHQFPEISRQDFSQFLKRFKKITSPLGKPKNVVFFDDITFSLDHFHTQILDDCKNGLIIPIFITFPEFIDEFETLLGTSIKTVDVGPLSDISQVEKMIQHYAKQNDKERSAIISDKAINSIWYHSKKKPFLIQLLFEYGFQSARKSTFPIDSDHIESVFRYLNDKLHVHP